MKHVSSNIVNIKPNNQCFSQNMSLYTHLECGSQHNQLNAFMFVKYICTKVISSLKTCEFQHVFFSSVCVFI